MKFFSFVVTAAGILGWFGGAGEAFGVDPSSPPLRLGIVGLVHGHVHGVLGRLPDDAVEIVGIAEPDTALARRYADQYGIDSDLLYASLEEMLDEAGPEAVAVFTSTYDHKHVVETCASRGVHVMVEKPLAVNMEHARAMRAAAEAGGIHLLTNYETTWYPSVHHVYHAVHGERAVGALRKIVVRDGHPGPVEIGVRDPFLSWLTDPELNGGGALTDFGCYGADLITWLMQGVRPLSVTAVTQQIKPHLYPEVDDEATILLTYPKAQGIIQASWNWPVNRKDMEVYGTDGYVHADDRVRMRVRTAGDDGETRVHAGPLDSPYDDPFAYFAAVVRGETVPDGDLSSLETNLLVVEILDAARLSAESGRTVHLPASPVR